MENLEVLAGAPGGARLLRRLVLELAVLGLLVPQDSNEYAEFSSIDCEVKNQGLIKPHKIPSSWSWAELGDVGEIVGGGTPKVGESNYWASPGCGIPWVTPADLNGLLGRVVLKGRRDLTALGLERSSARILPIGTVLFSSRAPIGYVAIAGCRIATNQGFKSIIPSEFISSEYLYWYLKWCGPEVDRLAPGTTFREVSGAAVAKILVAIPPLAEQHRIVAKVDELMALCDRLEARQQDAEAAHARLVQALLDSLTQARDAQEFQANWERLAGQFEAVFTTESSIDLLKKVVVDLGVSGRVIPVCGDNPSGKAHVTPLWPTPATWEWRRLIDVVDGGIQNGISPKAAAAPTEVRCLTLSATTRGKFDASCFKFVDLVSEVADKYKLRRGDLLVQRANSIDYVGVSAVYDQEDGAFIFPDLMMRVRPCSDVDVNFLHLCLSSGWSRAYLRSKATGTQGNMPKVNQGTVGGIPVPVPDLLMQQRIVAKVNEFLTLCDRLKSRITATRAKHAQLAEVLVKQAVEA